MVQIMCWRLSNSQVTFLQRTQIFFCEHGFHGLRGYYLLQIAQRTLILLNTNITNNTNILGSNTDNTDYAEHCYSSISESITSGEVPIWVMADILRPPLALREWPQ